MVEEKTPEILEAIRIEAEAVAAAELENYELAIATFQKSIDLAPIRAAPYNNRAQAYRLMGNDEGIYLDIFIYIPMNYLFINFGFVVKVFRISLS